jgi:2-dehydro-3-deoxygalactonokinase
MTGEVFAVMKAHSILGRMMRDGPIDEAAFADGVNRSGQAGGLLHHLFGTRSRALFGELPDAASASYLSGLLIGHEIRAAGVRTGRVHLLGNAQLAASYAKALAALGMESSTLDPDMATRALHRLAGMLPA